VTRRLRTAAPAVDELSDAVRWYEGRRVGLGGELFDAVTQAIELIESHPEIGEPTSADRQTRRTLVPRFPYQIVYRLRPDEIVIVAVAHLKRRPGYWKTRG
jgi:plasmid stabilization system protein ParE